jgi:hypothetical protein
MVALPQLIKDLVELALDADDLPPALREQLDDLCEKSRRHTGVGIFVGVAVGSDRKYNGPDGMWDAAVISCPELPSGADAMVHMMNGVVVEVEILARSGDLPTDLPQSYLLQQHWNGSPGKWIEMKNGDRRKGDRKSMEQ